MTKCQKFGEIEERDFAKSRAELDFALSAPVEEMRP